MGIWPDARGLRVFRSVVDMFRLAALAGTVSTVLSTASTLPQYTLRQ